MFPKCLDEAKRMSSIPFRELVGGLQCVAQCTRQEHSQPMQSAVSAAIHEKPSGRQSDDRVKNSATGIQMQTVQMIQRPGDPYQATSSYTWVVQ